MIFHTTNKKFSDETLPSKASSHVSSKFRGISAIKTNRNTTNKRDRDEKYFSISLRRKLQRVKYIRMYARQQEHSSCEFCLTRSSFQSQVIVFFEVSWRKFSSHLSIPFLRVSQVGETRECQYFLW